MHTFGPETKRTHPIHFFGPNSDVLVSFVTMQKTMPGLHLMHQFGPLTKRCTLLVHKRNERTQSTFLDPIVMFWSVLLLCKNHARVAFNEPVRTINETMHTFGPEMKRTHPIHFFGPNSDVLVSFVTVQKNHVGVAFKA